VARETKLRARRHELGLTLIDLERRTRITTRSIQRYESGIENPSLRMLVNLAYGLECESLAELIEDEWLEFRPPSPVPEPPGERPPLRLV